MGAHLAPPPGYLPPQVCSDVPHPWAHPCTTYCCTELVEVRGSEVLTIQHQTQSLHSCWVGGSKAKLGSQRRAKLVFCSLWTWSALSNENTPELKENKQARQTHSSVSPFFPMSRNEKSTLVGTSKKGTGWIDYWMFDSKVCQTKGSKTTSALCTLPSSRIFFTFAVAMPSILAKSKNRFWRKSSSSSSS